MYRPEFSPSVHEALAGIRESQSYDDRIISMGLNEIYLSLKYDKLFIPDDAKKIDRTAEGAHLAIRPPGSPLRLARFLPGIPEDEQARLDKLIRQELDAAFRDPEQEGDGTATDEEISIIQEAVDRMERSDLHVFGAVQIGRYVDGVRSIELFYPTVFAEMLGSADDAATLSAVFLKHVE